MYTLYEKFISESLSSSDEIKSLINKSTPIEIPYDYMSVFSHHPNLSSIQPKPLTKMQELKLIQKLLKNVKYILTFEESILSEQKVYWLHLSGISGITTEVQRNAIKIAIESHCLTPVSWITSLY